jgi:flagellar motor switch protein FliN
VNPAEIDALVASVQANKGTAQSPPPAGGQAAPPDYAPPAYAELNNSEGTGTEVPLGMLLDLSLPVSIELGRTSMTVQEILRLGRGAVIQLERLAGEPIDIYVGDRRFAEGEVVVLGEHFGVRISRIFAAAPAQVMT